MDSIIHQQVEDRFNQISSFQIIYFPIYRLIIL
jgi:hypothetical protein